MTPRTIRAAVLISLAAASSLAAAPEGDPAPALAADDECAAGDERCSLSALQLRAQARLAASKEALELNSTQATELRARSKMLLAASEEEEGPGNCASYGCHSFSHGRPCQCNSKCSSYGNCCADYGTQCLHQGSAGAAAPSLHAGGCDFGHGQGHEYSLDWKAEGSTFYKDMTFMTVDEVHGAHEFVSKSEAMSEGLIGHHGDTAFMRVGGASSLPYKRKSVNVHTNYAWAPGGSMIALMKFKHIPFGPGVWPSFWMMNSDVLWPGGGELDVLETANDEASKVSFHTSRRCHLDSHKLNKCMHGRGMAGSGPLNCETDYFHGKLGCRPKQWRHTGEWYSQNPGVIGAEWTPEHVKVFYIPEHEIPEDLASDKPQPDTWDKFIVAYLPFGSGCSNVAMPQELVINIQLCGDWAGGAWEKCPSCVGTGYTSRYLRCIDDIFNPAMDCCTKYVTEAGSEQSIRSAYFDMNWVKVYTSPSAKRKLAGTFKRGGMPLQG